MSVSSASDPAARRSALGATRPERTLLAIDACGCRPGVGLWDGSAQEPAILHLTDQPARAEGLAACVQRLLDDRKQAVASITCLAVVTGPGSYTGLRTGLAFVRGLALLDGLPVAPVSALERLAFCGGTEGEQVVVAWPVSEDLVVAGAYRIGDGIPVALDPGGTLDSAQLLDFLFRCGASHPGRWVLAVEAEGAVAAATLPAAIDVTGIERRVVHSQRIEALARLGYAKCAGGLGVSADLVLPQYLGTSLPRSNRNRVAAPFVGAVTS